MTGDMLVVVKTSLRRYAIRRSDVFDIRLIDGAAPLGTGATFDRPVLAVELGAWLDPADQSTLTRRRALLVQLRRRYVALLVDYVEGFLEHVRCAPLPALLTARLTRPWAIGALALEDDLIVQLDLRAITRDVLLQRSAG